MEEVKTLTTNGGDFVKVRLQRFNVFRVYSFIHSKKRQLTLFSSTVFR